MVEGKETEAGALCESTMAQLFERQVARTPDAIAVISAGRSLTYCELDRRSNQLARHLRALGVQTEALVGSPSNVPWK